jgi:hypothetical protein
VGGNESERVERVALGALIVRLVESPKALLGVVGDSGISGFPAT